MTTQAKLIRAFCEYETSPTRASNMRMVVDDDVNTHAYLVGGRDGREVIFAEREIFDIKVYRRPPRGTKMYYTDIRRQQDRVRRITRRNDATEVDERAPDAESRGVFD